MKLYLLKYTTMRRISPLGALLTIGLLVSGCLGADQSGLHVRLVADGRERAFVVSSATSVGQFLENQGVTLGEFDKVYPELFTPLTDNLLITVIRVVQKQQCDTQDIPYSTLDQKTADLPPGQTKVIQAGVNGTQSVCSNVILEDGVEKSRTPGGITVVTQPIPEIVAHGIDANAITPATINGVIVYLGGQDAHIIEGNSVRQRTLPTGGNLDGRIFALSDTGKQLLYTRMIGSASASTVSATPTPDPTAAHFNELWVLLDVSDPNAKPVKLLADVLDAEWVPGQPNTISYSTGGPNSKFPFYEAFNDLIVAQLNGQTGQLIKANKLVSVGPTGEYNWWGTQYRWSPDGKGLAWAQADGIGTVDVKTGKLTRLLNFKVYSTTLPQGWVWVPSLSWSPSGTLLGATVHGPPEGSEPPDASPVFNFAVAATNSAFQVTLMPRAGMWARPQFSPLDPNGTGHVAYLRARDPDNSLNSDYDLAVANRDGSNSTALFPGADKPGLRPIDDRGADWTWSPDGHQLVAVYQGDLWLIDAASGHATQLTVVGDTALPRWASAP
ncbi:MAG: G5 domain-containing protein [Aggregatilineales bacterium]